MQFTVLTMSVLLCCCSWCFSEAVQETFYRVYKDYDIASFFQEINVSSLIKCAVYCKISTECVAATYDTSSKQCLLCDQTVTSQIDPSINKRSIVLTRNLATGLNAAAYKIVNNGDYKFWHYDSNSHGMYSPVTVLYQPDDNYVLFRFEQITDGSYKIMNPISGQYIIDGDDTCPCDSLNGETPVDEEHKRFLIYTDEVSPDKYRIVSKATGRYVRVDETLRVTSKLNLKDDYSLFTFVPV